MLLVFSNRRIDWRFATIGGVLFWSQYRIAKLLYDVYLAQFARLDSLYGSFAALLGVLIWVFFLANMSLFCAEGVKAMQIGAARRGDLR